MSETLFQNRVYLVFATVIRIPDVNFTIEINLELVLFDTYPCTRSAKFDTKRFDFGTRTLFFDTRVLIF